jgi:hypothetical protein
MARGQGHPARSVATAALASALMAVLAASGGCEVVVGTGVPAFACDPGPDVCPGNQICDPATRQCVAPCEASGCKANTQCDNASHLCVASGNDAGSGADVQVADGSDATSSDAGGDEVSMQDQVSPPDTGVDAGCRGLGCKCGGDTDCTSNLCAGPQDVASQVYSAAGSHDFCSKPCCTSADCDANTVCYAAVSTTPSTIGNYCVAPTWIGRSATLGTAKGGAACTSNSQCRSGLCAGNVCADTCCSTNGSATECAAGNECRFDNFPGAVSFDKSYTGFCGTAGSGANGSSCTVSTDCQSNLCDNSSFTGTCRNACRNTADCGGQGVSCAYVSVTTGAFFAACFPGAGTAAEGQSCTSDAQCQSQFCNGAGQCTDVCFSDSDCTMTGWRCRPEQVNNLKGGGTYWVMVCGS